MTREEAKNWFLDHMPMKIIMSTAYDAYSAALTALRPVSRERVEKVWRGEWIDTRESSKDVPTCMCSRCTRVVVGLESKFCPDCGAPMTDKAVEMVMERLNKMEEIKNEH